MTASKGDDPKVVKLPRKKAAASVGWQERLLANEKGGYKACVANAITALRYAPEWDGVLWFDEFSIRTVMRRPPPWELPSMDFPDTEWTDCDDIRLAEWLQHQGISINPAVAAQAVEVASRIYTFHPVREYLTSLPEWDGTMRLPYWLRDYLGVADTNYSRTVGCRWLISAVARIFEPGCKADCALILEGPQGLKKSTALSVLGGPWFTDQIADLGNKDSCVDVQGAWIMELAELDSMRRGDIGTIKAFMARGTDRFRMPYGKRTAKFQRQCIFAGTINPEGDGYLKDATGGRRFWPVKCTKIDIDALKANVDQLWAEAVLLYNDGHPWWLDTPELEQAAEEQQAERYQGDIWEGLIEQYLNCYKVETKDDYGNVTETRWLERHEPLIDTSIPEILTDVLDIEESRWNRRDQMRIGGVLTAMGFERYRMKEKGRREYRYHKTGPTLPGKAQGEAQGRAHKKVNQSKDLDHSGPTCPTCPTFSQTFEERKESKDENGIPTEFTEMVGPVGPVGPATVKALKLNGYSGPYLDEQGKAQSKVGYSISDTVSEQDPAEWGL
jgi:predicted P-loop ATPase